MLALCAWLAAPVAPGTDESEACLGTSEPLARSLAGGVDEALEVLRRAGYDPGDFRLELQAEIHGPAGFGAVAPDDLPGFVFLPRARSGLHPLRVHAASPCAVSWLWQPERLTAWQRGVIEQSLELLRRDGVDAPAGSVSGVEVVESRDTIHVALALDGPTGPSRVEISIDRDDLACGPYPPGVCR